MRTGASRGCSEPYQRVLPSIISTGAASRSKSSRGGRSPRSVRTRHPPPLDQSGDSRAAGCAEMVLHRLRPPAIGRKVRGRRRQAEPVGRVIGPEQAAFGAQTSGVAGHARRCLAQRQCDLPAVAASPDHRVLLPALPPWHEISDAAGRRIDSLPRVHRRANRPDMKIPHCGHWQGARRPGSKRGQGSCAFPSSRSRAIC